MSPAANAHDSWGDPPDPLPRRRRREAVDWASAEDLEVLGTIGGAREPGSRRAPADGDTADWMVLTLERDAEAGDAPPAEDRLVALVDEEPPHVLDELDAAHTPVPAGAPRARRPLRAVPDAPLATHPDAGVEPPRVTVPARPAPKPLDLPAGDAERRTVVVRGQPAAPSRSPGDQRRRPARRPSERVAHRPDRVALWAFGLGLLLILVAILSAAGA